MTQRSIAEQKFIMLRLETQRLLLRNFRESDIIDFYEYCSMKKVGPMAGWNPYLDLGSAQERLNLETKKAYMFAIELKDEHKVIGSIEIKEVKREIYKNLRIDENSKELGCVLSEKYWGNGYMLEAINKILQFCLNELYIDSVYACFLEQNKQCKRLNEKTGFKTIGRINDYREWINGTKSDLIVVQMTKNDF